MNLGEKYLELEPKSRRRLVVFSAIAMHEARDAFQTVVLDEHERQHWEMMDVEYRTQSLQEVSAVLEGDGEPEYLSDDEKFMFQAAVVTAANYWLATRLPAPDTDEFTPGPICGDYCMALGRCDGHTLVDLKRCTVTELIEELRADNPSLLAGLRKALTGSN